MKIEEPGHELEIKTSIKVEAPIPKLDRKHLARGKGKAAQIKEEPEAAQIKEELVTLVPPPENTAHQ